MIKLKKLSEKDLENRVRLLNHSSIACYLNTSEFFTLRKTRSWFDSNKNNGSRFDFTFNKESHQIGMGGLTNISLIDLNCELYMFIDPSYQGKGYGFQSCQSLCDFAFVKLNLSKVLLYTFASNVRANRLYEKVGFKLEGVLRKQTFKDGELHDRNIYGILKSEYK